MLLSVVVPEGLAAGDEFAVSAPTGGEFIVTVPFGIMGNVAIEVELPDAVESERVAVIIPDGVIAGDTLTVEAAWGGKFDVVVPEGLFEGDTLEVDLPVEAAANDGDFCEPTAQARDGAYQSEFCEPTAEAWDGGAAPAGGTYHVGEKVKVQRSNGAWSPAEVSATRQCHRTLTSALHT